ncbi:MAG: hypothetical protein ACXWI6_15090, partial [Burkholderiales bacterium]
SRRRDDRHSKRAPDRYRYHFLPHGYRPNDVFNQPSADTGEPRLQGPALSTRGQNASPAIGLVEA